MHVIDPGHAYRLDCYDTTSLQPALALLTFMKRAGEDYPGNVGQHPGTNCQEVLRALIDRVKYLNKQVPCPENQHILRGLRQVLRLFEQRAAARHGRDFEDAVKLYFDSPIETWPTCPTCGHVGCTGHLQATKEEGT